MSCTQAFCNTHWATTIKAIRKTSAMPMPRLRGKAFPLRLAAAAGDGREGHGIVSRQDQLQQYKNRQQGQNLTPLIGTFEEIRQ